MVDFLLGYLVGSAANAKQATITGRGLALVAFVLCAAVGVLYLAMWLLFPASPSCAGDYVNSVSAAMCRLLENDLLIGLGLLGVSGVGALLFGLVGTRR
jgi:hypothetical protein